MKRRLQPTIPDSRVHNSQIPKELAPLKRLCLNYAMAHKKQAQESGSVYFLKILMYFILGSIWIKVNGRVVLPIGLILGLIFSSHDHFQIDRKIEYAILLIAALLAFAGLGVFFNFATS